MKATCHWIRVLWGIVSFHLLGGRFCFLKNKREDTEHRHSGSSQGTIGGNLLTLKNRQPEPAGNVFICQRGHAQALPRSVGLRKMAPGWVTSLPCGLERFAYCDSLWIVYDLMLQQSNYSIVTREKPFWGPLNLRECSLIESLLCSRCSTLSPVHSWLPIYSWGNEPQGGQVTWPSEVS